MREYKGKKESRLLWAVLVLALVLSLWGCKDARTVHCDHCGSEITLDPGSNIEEDWIIFCKECENTLFGDNPVVS